MRFVATALLAVSLLMLSGCAAVERRLNKDGVNGCLDCESHCWPAGRSCWTRKCLCEPWVEECRSTKLPICSPCDRQKAREKKAREAAEQAAEQAAEEVAVEASRDVPETSPKIP